jgi:hypothetical protein
MSLPGKLGKGKIRRNQARENLTKNKGKAFRFCQIFPTLKTQILIFPFSRFPADRH